MVLPPWAWVDPWKPAISVPGRQQQGVQAHQQGLSLEKKQLEQLKGGQGNGLHLLYLWLYLVSWQGNPQRMFFGAPARLP